MGRRAPKSDFSFSGQQLASPVSKLGKPHFSLTSTLAFLPRASSLMKIKCILSSFVLVALFGACFSQQDANAATLVADPFIGAYNNWTEVYTSGNAVNPAGRWGVHLVANPTLMENGGGAQAQDESGSPDANNSGGFTPYILLQEGVTTGTDYSVDARMYTSDDDGFGLVFGYVDEDNYFRVSMRQQTTGSLGFTRGLSVQKVVAGVITQISPAGQGEGDLSVPTQSMIDNHTPIDISVNVVGTAWSVSVAGINGGAPIIDGTDANLTGGKTGIQSWYQRLDSNSKPSWGTEVDNFTVRDGAGATVFQDAFDPASPLSWRKLIMTNAAGVSVPQAASDLGNFSLRFNNTIRDDSNGFEYGTPSTTDHTDFTGPAIVVDDPGASSMSDYTMQVRITDTDNDGTGVLVRVQDDDTFYRVNFTSQATTDIRRPLAGMSVQKSMSDGGGGVEWTQLFFDDQFIPTLGQPFDVEVIAVGVNMIIKVTDDPDGSPTVHYYPTITDSSSPLLTGSVGLTNWGSGGSEWSPYGGASGPLVTDQIPEPTSLLLLVLGAIGAMVVRRR